MDNGMVLVGFVDGDPGPESVLGHAVPVPLVSLKRYAVARAHALEGIAAGRVGSSTTLPLALMEGSMTPTPGAGPISSEPPRWALDQAMEEVDEGESIAEHAWGLVRAQQQRDDERHDLYDDPDQGGEG